MISVTPVILCGGSGTRLWPLSRAGFPKQFLCLTGAESLFQQAVARISAVGSDRIAVGAPILVSNEEHRFLALEQLRETGTALGAALLEPTGRGTAPALTIAALAAREKGEDPILVVTPSDQSIADEAAYRAALQAAIREADGGAIVILGIPAQRPETGYGYIRTRAAADPAAEALNVEAFVEKPDAQTAQRYLEAGGYFWNSGMFVLRASRWLEALGHFRHDILDATGKSWQARRQDDNFTRPGRQEFAEIPVDSIDCAVVERCPGSAFGVRMVPLNAGWSDLGAWDAIWDVLPKDEAGNAHMGDVITADSRNTLVHATSRLVGLVGVQDLVVVETPDAVLVAEKSRCQDVKRIVNVLEAQQRKEHTLHRKVHRPWGWYDSVDESERFKVKRIQVKPKASLSLQKHYHRAEHWIVVKGTAEITCGDKTILLTENQSTYIPLGEVHRLSNPGNIPLEIIEVQSGSYLSEDDIVRIEDSYGRR